MVICREKIWILETLLDCNSFQQPRAYQDIFLPMNFLYRKLSENTRLKRNFEEKISPVLPKYSLVQWNSFSDVTESM